MDNSDKKDDASIGDNMLGSGKHQLMVIIVTAVLIVLYYNWSIVSTEYSLKNSQLVILELAPADPRSLMQGDYMVINYKFARDVDKMFYRFDEDVEEMPKITDINDPEVTLDYLPKKGYLTFNLNRDKVASVVGVSRKYKPTDDKQKIAIKYKSKKGLAFIGTNSYFFNEGTAEMYEAAKYGGVKVDKNGKAILTHLYDENLQIID